MIRKFSFTISTDNVSELELTRGKFRLCPQCLIVSGVLRKTGPSLMPSWEGTLLLEKNRTVLIEALTVGSSVGNRRAETKSRNGQ